MRCRVQLLREVGVKKFDDRSTTTVVTEERQDGALPAEAGLTAEEERVLRMRSGASLGPDAPLTSKLEGLDPAVQGDVAARLALIEASLLGLLDDEEDDPARAARKQRIVAALRDQGDE